MHFTSRTMTCVIGLTWALAGCSQSSGLPGAPSSIPISSSPYAAPYVTNLLPSVGSAGGGATTKIVGTGFRPGMVAMFDGMKGTSRFELRDVLWTTFNIETPAHAVGTVDLVVSNPDGQSYRVAAAYTYAPADSFDPNGIWSGYSLDGSDTRVEFVIQGNRLVSASCLHDDVLVPFTPAELPSVHSGEFSMMAGGGAAISGRIVSASEMVGTISVPSCTTTPLLWRVHREGSSTQIDAAFDREGY